MNCRGRRRRTCLETGYHTVHRREDIPYLSNDHASIIPKDSFSYKYCFLNLLGARFRHRQLRVGPNVVCIQRLWDVLPYMGASNQPPHMAKKARLAVMSWGGWTAPDYANDLASRTAHPRPPARRSNYDTVAIYLSMRSYSLFVILGTNPVWTLLYERYSIIL